MHGDSLLASGRLWLIPSHGASPCKTRGQVSLIDNYARNLLKSGHVYLGLQ